MDQDTQPKKETLKVKRGRPFQNVVGKIKKRSTRKPKVATTTAPIQRPTRFKVKLNRESDSDEGDQEVQQQQQSALQKILPYFSPFGLLNLTGPKSHVIPRSDTLEHQKLKSSVFGYYRDEIRKGKKKKNSIHLRPDVAAIHTLAGGSNNVECDRETVQGIRRKQDGTVEFLYNWFAKDEGKTNKKLLDDIQNPDTYFDTDSNNNTNNTTCNIGCSPSACSGISSSSKTSPVSKETKVVDLTDLNDDYSEQDFFITKLVSKEVSNRKMKTPKRNNNPPGDIALIVLD